MARVHWLTNAWLTASINAVSGNWSNSLTHFVSVLQTMEPKFDESGNSAMTPLGKNLCHATTLSMFWKYNFKISLIVWSCTVKKCWVRNPILPHQAPPLRWVPFDCSLLWNYRFPFVYEPLSWHRLHRPAMTNKISISDHSCMFFFWCLCNRCVAWVVMWIVKKFVLQKH